MDRALDELRTAVAEMPDDHWFQGMPQANLFAAHALVGQHERARELLPAALPFLPVPDRRNWQGAFCALDALVTGLTLIGDRERCAALYPLTLDYCRTGQVLATFVAGPGGSPQLAAALAADAAGLTDKPREHFEVALRQAHDVPIRIMQPTVRYWYGRSLSAASDPAVRARGRAMLETALADFRTLEMVLHANLAESFLRELTT